MAEHLTADHLKRPDSLHLFRKLLFAAVDAVELILDTLFRLRQLTGNTGNAVVVHESRKPMSAVWQVLFVEIIVQFVVQKPHRDLCRPVVVLRVEACPGTIHGNEPGQHAFVDDPHRQIFSLMPEPPAVQDTLCSVPDTAGNDRFMMVCLEILVFLAPVFLGFVVLEIRGIGLS